MQCRFINNATLVRPLFVGVAETVVGWLVCCGMGIVQCLFKFVLRHMVIAPVCKH